MKVLSYLDATSLLCISHVNKRLHKLASDKLVGLVTWILCGWGLWDVSLFLVNCTLVLS